MSTPPPAGQMWTLPTDGPVDDDLVRAALDNAFPGLPYCMTLEEAERRIRAGLAAALPLHEQKVRARIADEIRPRAPICGQFDMPFPGALGPCIKPPGHDGDHSEGDEEWEQRCGRYSKPNRFGGVLGPCVHPPGHDDWHLAGAGAAWAPDEGEAAP